MMKNIIGKEQEGQEKDQMSTNKLIFRILIWAITMIIVMTGLCITRSAWCMWGLMAPVLAN